MTEDLSENYRRAYDNRIGFGRRPALLLVDFVQAYFDPDCALFADVQPALDAALRVRAAAHAAGIPVILTRVVYHSSGLNGGRFFEKAKVLKHFVQGSPLGAWPAGLEPTPDELIIDKQYPSAFFGTSLASTLTAAGVDTVILTGLTTSGCVRATCIDTCSCGFIPIVVREACGDRLPAPHEANLFDMDAKYADVTPESAVVEYLRTLTNNQNSD
jgi:maleamate amidohydrolase